MGKENHYNVNCVVEESVKALVVPTVAKITIFLVLLIGDKVVSESILSSHAIVRAKVVIILPKV